MEKLKVFISQPMKDLSLEIIQLQRNIGIEFVKENFPDKEIVILDSYFEDFKPDPSSNNAVKYLAKSIEVLADADLAVFIGEWATARGCKIEHKIATEYGIETMKVNFPESQ